MLYLLYNVTNTDKQVYNKMTGMHKSRQTGRQTNKHIVRCFKVDLYCLRLMTNDAASSSACLSEHTASLCEDDSSPYLFGVP
jgi:hypothetical protein